jgi:translocation and assembly module TamA
MGLLSAPGHEERRVKALTILLTCVAIGSAHGQTPPASATPPGDSRQQQRDAEEERAQRQDDRERQKERESGKEGKPAFEVAWEAPQPLRGMLEKFLPPPTIEPGQRRATVVRPWIRDVRRRVPEIAASEGYFSAAVAVDFEDEAREQLVVKVTPGARTTVGEVDISFEGDIAGEGEAREARRRKIRESWTLAPGTPFRSADWESAKTRLLEELTEVDYAVGAIASSEAVVEAEAARARLRLVLDSGPPFTYGDLEVSGLEEYSEHLVRRIVDLRQGERYSRERLSDLQRQIQNGPWFASVVVDVERDPARASHAPIKVSVVERPRREVGLAVGYGTDDGARIEAGYRYRDLFDRGFDLQSSVRASEKRQIGYADVYLPPGLFTLPWVGRTPFRDSVGVLAEYSDVENFRIERFAVAGYRHFKLDRWELRGGLSYQIERTLPQGSVERIERALAPIVAVTWRTVDDFFDPKRGGVLNVQFAAATKAVASTQDFFKAYAVYNHWFTLGESNQLLLRAELGSTIAESREGIPEDFLFRAGGSRSNRGYAYQSLGVTEGDAIVGGRYIATGTVEFVRWLNPTWGAAAFVDVGDATDTRGEWQANPSYGIGARYKTPAGPFGLDLAYAEEAKRWRLSFSVTVAF